MTLEAGRIEFLHHLQLVAPEADDLDVEIVVDEFELLAQRHERVALLEQAAENLGELEDHLARRVGIEAHQRGHGVERVEQEVRIDLALQRVHAGLQQQPLLLFQLHLNAARCSRF